METPNTRLISRLVRLKIRWLISDSGSAMAAVRGGLGHIELLGSPVHGAGFRNGEHILNLMKRHSKSLFLSIV